MINWRNGKGGFVGGLKNIIGGVFRFSHSITSATVEPELGPGFGINARMSNNGLGIVSAINNDGLGDNGLIVLGFGSNATMNNYGIGKTGLINNDGIGENGEL